MQGGSDYNVSVTCASSAGTSHAVSRRCMLSSGSMQEDTRCMRCQAAHQSVPLQGTPQSPLCTKQEVSRTLSALCELDILPEPWTRMRILCVGCGVSSMTDTVPVPQQIACATESGDGSTCMHMLKIAGFRQPFPAQCKQQARIESGLHLL